MISDFLTAIVHKISHTLISKQMSKIKHADFNLVLSLFEVNLILDVTTSASLSFVCLSFL